MNKNLVRIIALAVLPCLFTEQLAEPAFSDVVAPWNVGSKGLRLNGWIANFNAAQATRALANYPRHLSEMSVFGVGAHMNGQLAPETDFIDASLAAAHKLPARPRILLTVANIRPRLMQDRWLLHHWIGSAEKRRRHTWDLLKLAERVDGLDIDYENMRIGDGREFTQFVVFLGRVLHAHGKVLTVTIEHQTLTHGDIDWKAVSASADRVRVMAYQFHYDKTEPGAVSPPDDVVELAAQALRRIPAPKLEMALPLYGFDWTEAGSGKLVASMEQYQHLARLPGARVFRDRQTQSARIKYVVSKGKGRNKRQILHQVWFEDAASAAYKIRMLQRLGIRELGLWQVAAGDVSDLFKRVASPSFLLPSLVE